ncbi:MAG: NAD(P)/FAD-dependent oxidoreductase [Actinomycetes bacterium]
MRHLVVLGAGTAGATLVNKLQRRLPDGWRITVVDPSVHHHYQPGYLFIPFGTYEPGEIVQPTRRFVPAGVEMVAVGVERVDAEARRVHLGSGASLPYDLLVIATGTHPRPEETPGLAGPTFRRDVHEFYTLEGAVALRDAWQRFDGGEVVVHVAEMPIKCPVAPLEFAFLAEADLRARGLREVSKLTYVTPLPGAFTKPIASAQLGGMLDERRIGLEPDFAVSHVDGAARQLVSYDDRRIPYDLLVTVPVNMGAPFVGASGLGDELDHVVVDPATLRHPEHPEVFAVGDAAALPTSKAGSVAHFSVDVLTENLLDVMAGREPSARFDGHANCFVETGDGRAMLIDFNYETEPLPGTYPVPGIGPFHLLEETELNHAGKLAFRWMYWHVLLEGRPIPLPTAMSMAGKKVPAGR